MDDNKNVHLFDSNDNSTLPTIIQSIEQLMGKGCCQRHRSLDKLLKGLRRCTWDEPVIIFVRSDDELEYLDGFSEYLSYYQIILVLHNDQPPTIRKGHQFRPRMLLSQPIEPETIASIIERMLTRPKGNTDAQIIASQSAPKRPEGNPTNASAETSNE